MSYRTMTARYAGACRGCSEPVVPGDVIVYGGRGKTYHVDCSGHKVIEVTRFSSGAVVYRNARGICEDAPCCGCCTF